MDTGIHKSWLKRVSDSIFGKEEAEAMVLRPYGVFADSQRVYVTDPGIFLVHVFDIRNNNYFQIKKAHGENLLSPIGIAVDKKGDIYVSDSILKKIFVFDKDGKYLREIGKSEVFGRPAGIAIVEDRLYVVDTHAHKILVFSGIDGSHLFSFGKQGISNGEFNYPTNIFINKDKVIHITDSMNFRVQMFDKNGIYLSSFGKHGDGSGDFSKPKGLAVDSEDHIYVADANFDNVQIFDKDGRLLLWFGNSGSGIGEMFLPAGIFIDDQDQIYVADSFNNRILIFQYLKEKQ
jgi:DNA-binding beta-propeller fold protein YncE